MSSYEQEVGYYEKNPVLFTVSEFAGKEYLHLREYYQDFSGELKPTNKGVSMEYSMQSAKDLFKAFMGVLSNTEFYDIVMEGYLRGE